jgi:hypothetical protein
LRAGTLDRPETAPPDAHIYTRSKLSWLELPGTVPAFEALYNVMEFLPPESRERLRRNFKGEN